MANKSNKRKKISSLKLRRLRKKICASIPRTKKGTMKCKNHTENQRRKRRAQLLALQSGEIKPLDGNEAASEPHTSQIYEQPKESVEHQHPDETTIPDGTSALKSTIPDGTSALETTIPDGTSALETTIPDGTSALENTRAPDKISAPKKTRAPKKSGTSNSTSAIYSRLRDRQKLSVGENKLQQDKPAKILKPVKKPKDREICRICLATDVKMYLLTKIAKGLDWYAKLNKNPNLPQYVCYQCAPKLIQLKTLMQKSLVAETTLLGILKKKGKVTKNLVKQKGRLYELNLKAPLSTVFVMSLEVGGKHDMESHRGNIDRYIDISTDREMEHEIIATTNHDVYPPNGKIEHTVIETTDRQYELHLPDGEIEHEIELIGTTGHHIYPPNGTIQYEIIETIDQHNEINLSDADLEHKLIEITNQQNEINPTDAELELKLIEIANQQNVLDSQEFENIEVKTEVADESFVTEDQLSALEPQDFDEIVLKVEPDEEHVEESVEQNIDFLDNQNTECKPNDDNDDTKAINPQWTNVYKRPGSIISQEYQSKAKVIKEDTNDDHDINVGYFDNGERRSELFWGSSAVCKEPSPASETQKES